MTNATVPWAKILPRALHDGCLNPFYLYEASFRRATSPIFPAASAPRRTLGLARFVPHYKVPIGSTHQPGSGGRTSRLGGHNALVLVNRGPAARGDSASQRREAGSFEDFFTEWYSKAVVFAMQRTAGAAEADAHDAVQNAMIKLFRCWGRPDHPKAYLITITMRECARIVKDRRRHGCVTTEDDPARAESARSEEGEIDNRLLIVELVQKLPPA